MKKETLIIFLLAIPASLSFQAAAGPDIYKHVDKDGNITFTNRRIPNAEKISLASYSRTPSSSKTSVNTSKPSTAAQKERNLPRRTILENELLTEEQLFTDTQRLLQQFASEPRAENHHEKAVRLRNKLFQHQRNISALKKELARL